MLPIRKKATCVRSASSLAISISHQSNSLAPEEILIYEIYLAEERKVSVGTRIVAVSACDSPYAVTLQRDWTVQLIPAPKWCNHTSGPDELPYIRQQLFAEGIVNVAQSAPGWVNDTDRRIAPRRRSIAPNSAAWMPAPRPTLPSWRLESGRFGMLDSAKARMPGTQRLMLALTLRKGQVVWDLNGLASEDWQKFN